MRRILAIALLATTVGGSAEAGIFSRGTPEQRAAKADAKRQQRQAKALEKAKLAIEKQGPTLRMLPFRSSDLERPAPGTPVASGGADHGRVLLRDAMQVKQRFRDRARFVQEVLLGRIQPTEKSPTLLGDVVLEVEEQLELHPVFVVDKRGHGDKRVLRKGPAVRRDANLLLRRLSHIPGVIPGEYTSGQVKAAIGELDEILSAQDVFTKNGLSGVRDLLHDDVMAERLAARTAGRLGGRTQEQTEALIPLVKSLGESSEQVRLARIDPGRVDSHPLELQVAAAKDPAVKAAFDALAARGVKLRLQRVTKTPAGVLEAINLIAVTSQENYLRNWLPPLVTEGKQPNLRPTQNGLSRARGAGLIARDEDPMPRLRQAASLIEASTDQYLRVVSEDGRDDLPELVRINRALDGTRRAFARRRMLYDNAHERTEGAQAVIKALLVIGPIAHGLEMMNLSAVAKVGTSMVDDVGAEIGEWRALRGSGYETRELVKRARVLAPVAVGAGLLAYQSHKWLEHGHELLGGATFGASAVALSLTTALQSIKMYRKGYEILLAEGKIGGKVGPAMRKQFQRRLAELERQLGSLLEPKNRPQLTALVAKSLDEAVAAGTIDEAEKAETLRGLEKLDMKALVDAVKLPGSAQQWGHAVMQDFSNPARLGLILGAMSAPVTGMLAGARGLLHNGFVLAGVGSTESFVAAATVFAAGRIDEARYNAALGRELARAQGNDRLVPRVVKGTRYALKAPRETE